MAETNKRDAKRRINSNDAVLFLKPVQIPECWSRDSMNIPAWSIDRFLNDRWQL